MARLSDYLQAGLSGLGTLVFAVINYVIIGITAIILSYYFLVNAKSVRESFLGLFPERVIRAFGARPTISILIR